MILPDYSGGSIVNLMASIEQAMGSDSNAYPPATDLPASSFDGCDNIIFLVVDGLGYDFLTSKGKGSNLESHLRSRLTSVCPSTTSAAVPTFLTGVAPQQHGFTGWFTWFRELGSILSVLPFQIRHGSCNLGQLGFNPGVLSNTDVVFNRIQARSHVVVPERIAESDFNLAFHDGARICPYEDMQDFFDVMQKASVAEDGNNYVYAYWSEFDALAHSHDIESDEVLEHFAMFDEAFGQFVAKMQGRGCKVVVTADHGFIDVQSSGVIQVQDHPELAEALVIPLCGEQRFAYAYLNPNRVEQFKGYVQSELSHALDLYSSTEILEQGWFGTGKPHPELESRVGHYAMVMKPGYKIRDRVLGEKPKRHIGVHGGVTPDEMYVPLIVADC